MNRTLSLALLLLSAVPASAGVQEEYQAARRLFESGDHLKAMDAFRAVLARYPTSPAAAPSLYHIGLSAERAGHADEARTAYRTFLTRHPNHDLAPFTRQRLKEIGEGATAPVERVTGEGRVGEGQALSTLENRLLGSSAPAAARLPIPAVAPTQREAPPTVAPPTRSAGRLERSRTGELGYVLGTNETLVEAANRIWGDSNRSADLARWNDLAPNASVRAGQRLRISPPRPPASFPGAVGSAGGTVMGTGTSRSGPEWPTEAPSHGTGTGTSLRSEPVPSLPALPHGGPTMTPRLPSLATGAPPALRRSGESAPDGEVLLSTPSPRPSASRTGAAPDATSALIEDLLSEPLLPVSLGEIPVPNISASVAPPPTPAATATPPVRGGARPSSGLLVEPRPQPRGASWSPEPSPAPTASPIWESSPSFRLAPEAGSASPMQAPQGVVTTPARESVATGAEAARARLGVAASLRRAGQPDEAEAELRAAIAAAPDMPVAYNNLADLLLESGRTAEAKGLAEKSIALAPSDPGPYLDTLGWTLHLLGMESEALARLNQAVEAEATPTRLYHRGIVFSTLGQIPRARRDLEEAVSYNPDAVLASKIREALERMTDPARGSSAPAPAPMNR